MTREEQFDVFWRAYPRRIAKGAARTAFDKAIRKTTLETMLSAIADYARHKPERIDFKHPATWLNQECWDDEWQSVPAHIQHDRRPAGPVMMSEVTGDLLAQLERRH